MRIAQRKSALFFLCLGVCLAGLALAVGSGWIILNWRYDLKVVFGIIFFGVIAAGMILNTSFLVREIRRNEQHDSFINAVTHELKTPIASIRLYLQTLERRDVDEVQRREFYRLMLDDADRLLGTVEQVLKAGEARHKRDRRHTELDFENVVQECVAVARSRYHLEADTLRFESLVNGARPIVKGDGEDLHVAVSNVLDNAVKYSTKGVDVAVRLTVPDEKRIVLSVQDHGVGVPAQELKRIFRRFYRVRSLRGVKGTGLGLFIVRSITEKHGGRVFAQSEGEGKGTTIVMELPRSVA
jgi:two-component system sensor histidine kinase SenX3